MTLDEAIIHCEEKACGTTGCAMEHKQLCEWLKELRRLTGGKDVITVGKENVMAAIETGDDNTKAVLRKLFGMEGCAEGKPPVSGQAGCRRGETEKRIAELGDTICPYCPWTNGDIDRTYPALCEGNWCGEAYERYIEENEQQ